MQDLDFIDFQLVDLPELKDSLTYLSDRGVNLKDPDTGRQLLILYEEGGDNDFLKGVLHACGYENPDNQTWQLPWPVDKRLDITKLQSHLGSNMILLFGQSMVNLGLHLNLATYSPLSLGETTYLKADALNTIRDEKLEGKPQKAAALWQALKTRFLFKQD
ncbi:MAG: hypothetical protein AAGF87_03830 [Bacteroidota bacterium]